LPRPVISHIGSQPRDQDKRHASSAPKGKQEVLQTRGEEQFKEAGSRQVLASSFKSQAQGRKDTPSRSKDSSSFKTQQTGQGRRPKAEFKVHSVLSKKDKYKRFTATRPFRPNTTNLFIYSIILLFEFYSFICVNLLFILPIQYLNQ